MAGNDSFEDERQSRTISALERAEKAAGNRVSRTWDPKEWQEDHRFIEAMDRLAQGHKRDALTKLHNRRHFDERATTLFSHAVRHKQPFTMVIGDIDFFKKIKDQFSHATGDAVLRHVGEILRSHMRLSDLVARYGGEEFVLALPETELRPRT